MTEPEVKIKKEVETTLNSKNWFQRHLNVTLAVGIILCILGFVFLGNYVSASVAAWLGVVAGFGIMSLIIQSWYLYSKERSLWFLLLNFIPLGFLVLFGLTEGD